MDRRTERKLLWGIVGILLIIQVAMFIKFIQQDVPQSVLPIDDSIIENVAKQATPSVVYIQTDKAAGSGVIVKEGYIVTNSHVVDDALNISVRLQDKRIFPATLVGMDLSTDVAVIKIPENNLPAIEFADSDKVEVGEPVIAIGNPFGFDFTVTSGIISAKHRDRGPTDYRDFLQTDASINPGNSGGPLLNKEGKLLGITTFIISQERTGELGFAIPSNLIAKILDRLLIDGKVERGYLGVSIEDVTEVDKTGIGRLVDGARITSLDARGPAGEAGLQVGDLIVEVDGTRITDGNQLRNFVAWIPPGKTVQVAIVRNGQQLTIPVTVGLRPAQP